MEPRERRLRERCAGAMVDERFVRARFSMKLFASISRLHIVVIAALGTLTFGWLFLGERPFALATITALDWFLVNLLNRVVDIPEDRANKITGTDFVARHSRAISRAAFATLFLSLVFVHPLFPAITPYRIAFHSLGLAYNWPLLPGRRRIKQLYFFKNTASATGFMLTVFCYPLAGGPTPQLALSTILASAAFFFLFELSYEVIYDLRDVEGDALAGVRTYPVVHGPKIAVRIADALILISMLILATGYALDIIPWRILVMIAAPAIQLVIYKRALARGITSRDCITITWIGATLLATYHVWAVLELPGAT